MPLPVIIAAAALSAAVALLWWAVAAGRPQVSRAESNLVQGIVAPTDLRAIMLSRSASDRAVLPVMHQLAGLVRRVLPAGQLRNLEARLAFAGRPAVWPIERVLAAKVLLGASGAALGGLAFSSNPGMQSVAFAAAATGLGAFGPDLVLSRLARERQQAIQVALPDTLDQITICVEAGLGFEAAMARAGSSGHGPLAEELVRTLQEMQLGATRGQALRALIARTYAPDLRRFVLALVQAESYGLPIADVLRTQSAELRVKRRQRAEEHAMKIPVKVIFPLVLCILPTLMIAVLGPAGIRMSRFFAGGMP